LEESGRFYVQGARERHDVEQSDVSLSALDAAYVVAMQIRQFRELFLGKPLFETKLPQLISECDSGVGAEHLGIFRR
jgi:hypothetical protein